MKGYVIDYINECEFKKLERALKKYDMLAYKKLNFECYPSLRNGKFLGILTSENKKAGTETYELELPAQNKLFTEVHGEIKLIYTVYIKEQTIMLNRIEPTDLLLEGHQSELTTYKGIMISKNNAEKDMFKIDLLKQLQGNSSYSHSYQYNFNTKTNTKRPRELPPNFVSPKTNFKQPTVDIEVIWNILKWYIDINDETLTEIDSSKIDKKAFVKTLNIAQGMYIQKEYITNNILHNFSKKLIQNY